jgi:hypothetical protein
MEMNMRNDAYDDDDIVEDGGSVRVRIDLMDAVQRAVATEGLRLHDGLGNPAGHKRGYVFGGNAEHRQRGVDAYDARAAAYAAYVQRLTSAWRSPAAAAERNEAQLEAWREPRARPGLRQDAATDRAAAHAAYVERIQNAWRAA